MLKSLHLLGRALGVVCGTTLSVAWVFALWVPSAGLTLAGASFVVGLLMAVLALFAVIASWRGHFTVVVLLFLASFFPVGVSLLPRAHWMHWVGWADVGLLAAAALMWVTRRACAPVETAEGRR